MALLHKIIHRPDDTPHDEEDNRHSNGLAGLALSLGLVIIGLVLVKHLHHISVVEDCLLQGKSNCDILVSSIW